MKFADIPPFIGSSGLYVVNHSLVLLEGQLRQYEADYGLDLNPDFQRGHVWNERQQIAFVEFFLRGGATSRIIYFNSPWFASAGKQGAYGDMVIVDGLQRLTALRRFLADEIPAFGATLSEYEDTLHFANAKHNLQFAINGLQTRAEVLQWYLEFNTGGVVHTPEEIQRVRNLLGQELSPKTGGPGQYDGFCAQCDVGLAQNLASGNWWDNETERYVCKRCALELNKEFTRTRSSEDIWHGRMRVIEIDRDGKRPEID